MSTSFAGSRCLDERRRRRLAGEADEFDFDSPATHADRAERVDGDPTNSSRATSSSSHFPISRLISRKLWKLWAFGLLVLLVGGNILLAGSAVASGAMRLGPGFAWLFDLSTARVVKPLATLLLLLASQLTWLIWWVRSRSPNDFDGRYRVWGWCAAVGIGATLTVAAGLHIAWAGTALWLWDIELWNKPILIWMLPAVLAATWVLRALHREMRDCRSSLSLLWMAAACGLGVALLNLNVFPLTLSSAESRLICWSAELAACWLLFMSLLLHARHVVHVTADPARIRPARFTLRSLLRVPKLPRRREKAQAGTKPAKETAKPKQDENKPGPAKEPAATKSRKPRKTPAKSTKASSGAARKKQPEKPAEPPVEEPVELAKAVEEQASDPPAAKQPAPTAEIQPVSVPLESATAGNSMKGLSKRERRRLRKQQREEEREAKSHRRAA